MNDKPCSGDNLTVETDAVLDNVLEAMSVAKGKGLLTEDKYDEAVEQADNIRKANSRLKCLIDSIPKEEVNPVSILEEVQETKEE